MATKTKDSVEISLSAVSETQREKNHQVLQPVLTDLIAFSLIVKQLHWNVVGPHFRAVHLHLDEVYAEVLESVDEVAERLSATGHSPSGSINSVAKNTELQDVPEGYLRDSEVLLLASARLHELAGLIRSRMALIEEDDTVTADLLHQVVAKLEKQHWMIQAQRI